MSCLILFNTLIRVWEETFRLGPPSKVGERSFPEIDGLDFLLTRTDDISCSGDGKEVHLWKSPVLENTVEGLRVQFPFIVLGEIPIDSIGCGVLNTRKVDSWNMNMMSYTPVPQFHCFSTQKGGSCPFFLVVIKHYPSGSWLICLWWMPWATIGWWGDLFSQVICLGQREYWDELTIPTGIHPSLRIIGVWWRKGTPALWCFTCDVELRLVCLSCAYSGNRPFWASLGSNKGTAKRWLKVQTTMWSKSFKQFLTKFWGLSWMVLT